MVTDARGGDGPTITLVVNPHSGHGRAGRLLPRVCTELLLARPDARLSLHRTESYDHARAVCHEVVAAADRTPPGEPWSHALVVMGGDGMAHLGINACTGTEVPLGVLPAGTGNDFCRGAGLPRTVAGAVRSLAEGHTRRIDVARLSGDAVHAMDRVAGSVVSTGYDARVNHRANSMSTRLGGLAYAWAALTELADFEPLAYRLQVDGEPRDLRAMLIAVGNAGVFGGGMRICPDASVDDGLLDITIVHPVSRATLLRLLPTMRRGSFVRHPAIEQLRCRVVRVEGDGLVTMADGEHVGAAPVEVDCWPSALRVIG